MKQVLVVGAGISGCILTYQLLKKGCSVTLLDSGENFSSTVAAGQINPLVFRRMTLSWRVDDFLPKANSFYRALEEESQIPFIHNKFIRRIFSHQEERELWLHKQDQESFTPYMHPLTEEDDQFNNANNICGSGRVKQSYYVDSISFLKGIKKVISANQHAHLLSQQLDYSKLNPETATIDGVDYDEVIFCEGFQNYLNPWFGHYPVTCTKGQTLTIASNEIYDKESLNRKCFVLPLEKGVFKVGSTYEWDQTDTSITEEGRKEIEENLAKLTSDAYEVIKQEAGIRPTTRDRRPIIGRHTEFNKLSIFNGLGAKGYLLAPKLVEEFLDYLLEGKSLDKEVDLARIKGIKK
jgi:glycine oxidase